MIYLDSTDLGYIAGEEYFMEHIRTLPGPLILFHEWVKKQHGKIVRLRSNRRYVVEFVNTEDALVYKLRCGNCIEIGIGGRYSRNRIYFPNYRYYYYDY